jgi:replicative DNA helicase
MLESLHIPPHHLDAEISVVGAILISPESLDEIDLRADDFYSLKNEVIFRAVSEMWRSGCRDIDGVTVAHELIRQGSLADAGGAEYLADMLEAVPHAAHVKTYAKVVRECSQRRQIINACRRGMEASYDGDTDNALAILENGLLAIRESATSGEIGTMHDAVAALETREQNPVAVHSTGLFDLDRQIRGGFRDGQLIVVGGRPGSGKSVLSGQIAKSFAERAEPALVISLEMDRSEIAERYAQQVDRSTLSRLPIFLVDTAFESHRIASLIRLAKRKHRIQVAVVDYLQLTESSDRSISRERQVADVSRMLKQLARELRIPIVAACQLNRTADREQRIPRLSDLRESGAIEQDADIVILLHQGDDGAKAIVAKQRNGATGVVPLTFRGSVFRFENRANEFAFGSDAS